MVGISCRVFWYGASGPEVVVKGWGVGDLKFWRRGLGNLLFPACRMSVCSL